MSVKFSFEGRKVLITGGANGIGFDIAKKFMESGATVHILDQDDTKLAEAKSAYPSITTINADLMDWESTQNKIKEHGPFHHLVNNAGIVRPWEYLLDIKSDSVDQVFGVHFKGALGVTQAVAKGMIDSKLENPTVVNMSSISDTVGVPGLTIYSCTKAAITMLTKCMALELAEHGIRVNCVRPAQVKTDHVGRVGQAVTRISEDIKAVNDRKLINRLIEMKEVADAVMFLSSTASTAVNGSDILLDGGLFTR